MAVEGADSSDWSSTYGVTGDGSGGITLQFVTVGQYSTNIGSRMFMLDESGDNYYMFKLKNKEFTMDVDTSQLPCGLNGAVYFVEMEADGGLHYPSNKVHFHFQKKLFASTKMCLGWCSLWYRLL